MDLRLLAAWGLLAAPAWASLPVTPDLLAPSVVPVVVRAEFLHSLNPAVDLGTALNYSLLYEEEAGLEGVNPDLAFAQMILETSSLKFGGQVHGSQNNFAGLGALDGGEKGLHFTSPRLGVRAQVQHLKYYATTEPLRRPAVNPRLGYIKRGSAPTAWQLAGAWASDPDYGKKLMALVARMVAYAERSPASPARSLAQTVARPEVAGD